jgi:hypothetical protein
MASEIISRLRSVYGRGTSGLGSEYDYKSLVYPQELDSYSSGQNHMVVFHIWERKMSELKTLGKTGRTYGNVLSRVPGLKPSSLAGNAFRGLSNQIPKLSQATIAQEFMSPGSTTNISGAFNKLADTVEKGGSATEELQTSICLYMPMAYTTSHEVVWNVRDLKVKNWLTAGSVTDLVKQGGLAVLDGAAEWLNPAFSRLTGSNLEDVLQAGFGMVANPWQEQLFERVQFRNFSFAFAFRPRNEKESTVIRNIIQTFKYHMHPEVAKNFANRYFIYPSEFTIEFWNGGQPNNWLNKIGHCVLTNMSVDYADTGVWAAHRSNEHGAPPAALSLTMDFTEVELVTKNSIIGRRTGDTVGNAQTAIEEIGNMERID